MIIKELYFDITEKNRKLHAQIWVDDMDLTKEPIYLYQKGSDFLNIIYLLTMKDVNDEVTLEKNGQWWNLIPNPEDTLSFGKLFKNVTKSFNRIKNDSRIEVSREFAKEFCETEFKNISFMYNVIEEINKKDVFSIPVEDIVHIAKGISAFFGKKYKIYEEIIEQPVEEKKTKKSKKNLVESNQ